MYRPSLPKVHKQKIGALNFLLQPLPGHRLCSNSNHRQKVTPIYQPLPRIMGQFLQQKCTDMAYPGKSGHKFAVKHLQQLQNEVPIFGRIISDDFGGSHYGIKTIKMVSIMFERL